MITGSSTVVCFAVAKCRSEVETHLIGSEREVAFDPTHLPTSPSVAKEAKPRPPLPNREETTRVVRGRASRQWSWTSGEAADGLMDADACLPERMLPDGGEGEPAGDDRYSSTPVTM